MGCISIDLESSAIALNNYCAIDSCTSWTLSTYDVMHKLFAQVQPRTSYNTPTSRSVKGVRFRHRICFHSDATRRDATRREATCVLLSRPVAEGVNLLTCARAEGHLSLYDCNENLSLELPDQRAREAREL